MSLKRKAEEAIASSPASIKKPKAQASLTSFFAAPKGAAVSKTSAANGHGIATKVTETEAIFEAPSVKFDKQKWVDKLTAEQKELLKLEIDTLHESWLSQLKDEITTKEFLDLKRFLKKEIDSGKKIFPQMADVYSWYVLSPSSPDKASMKST
jgi:uracil-DNA glycosylase